MRIVKLILKYTLGLSFVAAGLNHFIHTDFYLRMMPPYLPWHLFLVYVSGFFEATLGVALLIKRSTRAAAWGLLALLVAVYPANIHMALNPHLYPEYNQALLWVRLPIQVVLMAWVYSYTRRDRREVKWRPTAAA